MPKIPTEAPVTLRDLTLAMLKIRPGATPAARAAADSKADAMLHTQGGIERNHTASNVVGNIRRMMEGVGVQDVLELYGYPEGCKATEAWIETGKARSDTTRLAYYNALNAVSNPERHVPAVARRIAPDARAYFVRIAQGLDRRVKAEADENLADAHELAILLPWRVIKAAYDERAAGLGAQQRLIADLYIGFSEDPAGAPRRLDYGSVHVYGRRPRPSAGKAPKNFVVVSGTKAVLHLAEFKTANSRHEALEVQLPPGLAARIAESLGAKPWRPYLLCKTKGAGDRCEPLSANTLGAQVSATLKALTGKEIPASSLRKSFITDLHSRQLSNATLKRFALNMGHSVEMASIYRKINIEHSVSDKKPATSKGGGYGLQQEPGQDGGQEAHEDRCFTCKQTGHRAAQCKNARS